MLIRLKVGAPHPGRGARTQAPSGLGRASERRLKEAQALGQSPWDRQTLHVVTRPGVQGVAPCALCAGYGAGQGHHRSAQQPPAAGMDHPRRQPSTGQVSALRGVGMSKVRPILPGHPGARLSCAGCAGDTGTNPELSLGPLSGTPAAGKGFFLLLFH